MIRRHRAIWAARAVGPRTPSLHAARLPVATSRRLEGGGTVGRAGRVRGARRERTVVRLVVGIASVCVALSISVGSAAGVPRQRDAAGTIRVAAEQEPFCADWISSCAGLSWGMWALGYLTLPQAMTVDAAGNYKPGAVLVDTPSIAAGPPMKVTYRIRSDAKWSDGAPITSKDFEYTWSQIVNGNNIYDTTGYTAIGSIDTTDPKVAVLTFSE